MYKDPYSNKLYGTRMEYAVLRASELISYCFGEQPVFDAAKQYAMGLGIALWFPFEVGRQYYYSKQPTTGLEKA